MPRHAGRTAQWLHAVVIVVVMNAIFAVVGMLVATVQRGPLRDRVRDAFESGDLIQADWSSFDIRRGSNQYVECIVLQMVTNPVDSPLRYVAGPIVRSVDLSGADQCRTLYRLTVRAEPPDEFRSFRYTRYWHGYNVFAALYLRVASLRSARLMLGIGLFGSLVLLVLVSIRQQNSRLRSLGLAIGIFGLFCWAIPYFGQAFSHGPGDTIVVMGLAGLIAFPGICSNPRRLTLFCALYGTLVVYLEFMTGPLPTAAGFLFPAVYAARGTAVGIDSKEQWLTSIRALTAFGLGAGLTVVLKLLLSVAVFGPGALDSFVSNFVYYARPASSDAPLPTFLLPFGRLYRKGTTLTYGSEVGAQLLFASAVGSWVASALLVALRRRPRSTDDLLAPLTGVLIVIIWIMLFQTHTFGHAVFMVRMMIVPISLGWTAVAWQLGREHPPLPPSRPA